MKKLFRLLFQLISLLVIILVGIFTMNTLRYQTKQIPVAAISRIAVEEAAIDRLAESIRIPTISSGQEIDTTAFYQLDSFIHQSYPLVDSLLQLKRINRFSRLYLWPGKNPALTPILLMGHMDVVPAEESSLDQWTQPPFSGKLEDDIIWGRGTLDNKCNVFGLLEAVEALLKKDYMPERSIYLAFGHDEEISGYQGANAIASFLKQNNIRLEYVLDEGGFILSDGMAGLEKPLALIGIAEKGYTSLTLTTNLEEGGHSAMPAQTTAIGILSKAIQDLQNHPFPARIDGATQQMFQYVGPEMSLPYKVLFSNLWLTEGIVKQQLSNEAASNAMIRTTTAPTMLDGGVKDNVLPANAQAVINFRILPGETPSTVKGYVEKIIDNDKISIGYYQNQEGNAPSPASTTNTLGFQVVQKSILELFPGTIISPSLVVGATDSRYFHEVCDNIYRFTPLNLTRQETKALHGINEKIRTENYLNMIRFYQQLILNSCK